LPKILEGYCNISKKPREIAEQEVKEFIQIISDSSEYQFGYNHSTGYSMNGYLCSYARTYFPLEFTTAYLNWAENIVDMNNGMKLLKEYGFELKAPRFRYSKGKFFFDRSDNSIYKGIGSIKFLNLKVGDELYELKNNVYDSFLDLLIDIGTKTSTDARQLERLIKIEFFKEFGSVKKLLYIVKLFDKLYGKKTLSLEKLDEFDLTIEQASKYGNKTAKQINKLNSLALLKDLIDMISDEEFPIVDIIKMKADILEYIDYVNPKLDKKICMVQTLNDKYNTKRVSLYCLNNGKVVDFKISGKIFNENPIKVGEIIYASLMKKEPKPILVGKDEKGKNIWGKDYDNMEWVLYKYNIIKEI
jgi:DNA polymerase-3 subunit alpha